MIPDSIVIDGNRQGERFLVIVDRQKVFLQPVGFRLFAILGIQLLLGEDDGWVESSQLWSSDHVSGYIYRLKKNVHSVSHQLRSWQVVENNKQGEYRLIARPDSIAVNPANIYGFGDIPLEHMLARLMSLKIKI